MKEHETETALMKTVTKSDLSKVRKKGWRGRRTEEEKVGERGRGGATERGTKGRREGRRKGGRGKERLTLLQKQISRTFLGLLKFLSRTHNAH